LSYRRAIEHESERWISLHPKLERAFGSAAVARRSAGFGDIAQPTVFKVQRVYHIAMAVNHRFGSALLFNQVWKSNNDIQARSGCCHR
jgi:hypothetical protein